MSVPLFSGEIFFVQVTFATPSGNFSLPDADMQTVLAYAQHAIVPILESVQMYGPSTATVSRNILSFTANMSSTTFSDSDLQGWVAAIVTANSLPADAAVVVPCPQQVSANEVGGNSGYHAFAGGPNVPYAVFGIDATGLTLQDQADVYAMVVSHEMAELIVDPQGNFSNPEVCDPCCENCEGQPGSYPGGFFRAYFDAFNDYLGTNQSSPPGGFDFAYYVAVVVKPAGAADSETDCHATTGDCTYPPAAQNFYFVIEKNNYGRDEVTDNPSYPLAFYLFLEGFSPAGVAAAAPSLSGSFNATNIPGLTITETGTTYDVGSTGADADLPQRIRFAYQIQFTNASLASFPAPNSGPLPFGLAATIDVQGQTLALNPKTEFFLLAGADPYFTNINAPAGNPFYLSQDLRVFTGTPATNPFPVAGPGAPQLTDSVDGAYNYIQNLVTWLNNQIGYLNPAFTPPDTNVSDPLDSLLQNQLIAQDGDSAVNQQTGSNNNYNFAIARVRLKGSGGPSTEATGVKVFFRVFTTQTFDTDFIDTTSAVTSADPNVTYPSSPTTNPQSPLPGTDGSGNVNGCSLPFFATKNFVQGPTDYAANGVNNQTIEIPSANDYAWAFFGCFLNVYDQTNEYGGQTPQYWLTGAAHSCLVAQIAYDDAPIINAGGVIENPENSDKLAQRNLQINQSGNPGFPVTHRVPQTIDVRPSPPPASTDPASIASYPDEMMIDWGDVPIGSVASIYWPAVNAAAVLQLAAQLYPGHMLSAADPHTIQCKVVSRVSYVPIPPGAGGSFAGLFTVDLPIGIAVGETFDVVVRRITTKRVVRSTPPPPPPIQRGTLAAADVAVPEVLLWRYVTGSFLVRINVQPESRILPNDENLVAVLKWRIGLIGPKNRWYPVLLRYIGYLSGRIDYCGGNAANIPPSPAGYQPPSQGGHGRPHHVREHCWTGKVIELCYDSFGDFEGFAMRSETGEDHRFHARERNIEDLVYRAWVERFVITVCVSARDRHDVVSVVLRRAPRPLGD
jgi:hypothetical protein